MLSGWNSSEVISQLGVPLHQLEFLFLEPGPLEGLNTWKRKRLDLFL